MLWACEVDASAQGHEQVASFGQHDGYHLGSKKDGGFSSSSSVPLSSSKTLTKQVGAAVTLCNYDRKLTVPVPGGPTAVLRALFSISRHPSGKAPSQSSKSGDIHNSPVTPTSTLPRAS